MEYARPATRLGTGSPLCSQPVTSRSMKTVQRSPRRVGQGAASARRANSPLMLMPSFSACSSRNEPVPAAQASFMAKSTTTPCSMEINLESWPPISKMVSTGSPFHEDRAALAQAGGPGRRKREAREFALDGDAQLFGLLLQERSGAGRAGFVHGEVHHHAVNEA